MDGRRGQRDKARLRHCCPVVIVVAALLTVTWPRGTASGASNPDARVFTSVATQARVVALTFDDGPSPYTPQILSLLRAYGDRATFFLVGFRVQAYPKWARAEAGDGDAIGNHTYRHVDLEWLTPGDVTWQLRATEQIIHDVTGIEPQWFRPPYGAVDPRVAGLAAGLGLRTVTWSVDPRDWSRPGAAAIVSRVLSAVRPGSVILLHDGGGDRSQTVTAVSILLPALRARGFRFVTLDKLFFPGVSRAAKPVPAGTYRPEPRPTALCASSRGRYSLCT